MKYSFIVLIVTALIVATGCGNNQEIPDSLTEESQQVRGALSSSPVGTGTIIATKTRMLHSSPLELAQQEYKDAYNDYVKHLRESGPQTIETLEALANYQRKYQIYQMLLNAD